MEEYFTSLKDILTEYGSVTVAFISSKLGLTYDKSTELFLSFIKKHKEFSILYSVLYNLEGNNLQMNLVTYDELQELSSKHKSLKNSVYAIVNNNNDLNTVSQQLFESSLKLSQEEMIKSQESNSLYIPSFVNLRISDIKVRNFNKSPQNETVTKKEQVKVESRIQGTSVGTKKEHVKIEFNDKEASVDTKKEVKKGFGRFIHEDQLPKTKVKDEQGSQKVLQEQRMSKEKVQKSDKELSKEHEESKSDLQEQLNKETIDVSMKSDLFEDVEMDKDENKETQEPPDKVVKVSKTKKKEKRNKPKTEARKTKNKEEEEVPEIEMKETLFEDDANDEKQEKESQDKEQGSQTVLQEQEGSQSVSYTKKSKGLRITKFIEKVKKEKTYIQNGYYVVEESDDYVEVVKDNTQSDYRSQSENRSQSDYRSQSSSATPKHDISSDKTKPTFNEKKSNDSKISANQKKMNQSSIMSFFKK